MTLLVEDLSTSQALEERDALAVVGGIGPSSAPGVGQLSGQLGQNSVVGSAASHGVLNTTLNLAVQVAPQINVQTANLVDLTAVTDITNVINSIIE